MKVEEFLQQGGPPGVVNELLVGSPVERLIHIFKQPKPSPINQDTGNLFLRPELRVEQGGCNMAGVAKRMRDGDSSMHEDGMHRDLFAKNSSSSCVESAMMIGFCMPIIQSMDHLKCIRVLLLLLIDFSFPV